MTETEKVHLDESKDRARVTLDRPPLNVLDIAMMRELRDRLASLKGSEAKVVVLGARGKTFCAGVDVADHTADRVREMIHTFHDLLRALWALPQPTVAVVQGAALGGGMELAVGCDFIVASQAAKFGQPEVKVGVFPPIACLLLPRMLPWAQAAEIILTGEPIGAEEAQRLGLVNRVVAPDALEEETDALIGKLMGLSGPVLRLAKRAALRGSAARWEREEALAEIERLYLDELMSLEDVHEGLKAFMEKRAPQWKER